MLLIANTTTYRRSRIRIVWRHKEKDQPSKKRKTNFIEVFRSKKKDLLQKKMIGKKESFC